MHVQFRALSFARDRAVAGRRRQKRGTERGALGNRRPATDGAGPAAYGIPLHRMRTAARRFVSDYKLRFIGETRGGTLPTGRLDFRPISFSCLGVLPGEAVGSQFVVEKPIRLGGFGPRRTRDRVRFYRMK